MLSISHPRFLHNYRQYFFTNSSCFIKNAILIAPNFASHRGVRDIHRRASASPAERSEAMVKRLVSLFIIF